MKIVGQDGYEPAGQSFLQLREGTIVKWEHLRVADAPEIDEARLHYRIRFSETPLPKELWPLLTSESETRAFVSVVPDELVDATAVGAAPREGPAFFSAYKSYDVAIPLIAEYAAFLKLPVVQQP